jgi:hypothetical protein
MFSFFAVALARESPSFLMGVVFGLPLPPPSKSFASAAATAPARILQATGRQNFESPSTSSASFSSRTGPGAENGPGFFEGFKGIR